MTRPANVRGYEECAEVPPKYDQDDLVVVQSHPTVPAQLGRIKWRRWECGNRTWGYAVSLEAGGSTMAIEAWVSKRS